MPLRRPRVAPEQHTDAQAAQAASVALLARRDFASGELRTRLAAQGFDEAVAAAVVAGLAAEGIVNDERYAQNYVVYHAGRGQGPVRIATNLTRLGLPAGLIEAALAGGPDWRALASRARRAKFGGQPPVSWTDKARQARFLQYRGFSSDHIRAATGADLDAD
jgi:regulatory protein